MDASLSRVIRRFFQKSAQVIVQARDVPPGNSGWTGKTDKWFSLESEELIAVRDQMAPWHGDGFPPLIIETTLSASHLTKQRIVLEEGGKSYPTDKQEVVLERWVLEWQPGKGEHTEVAVVYKRAVVALRCLFSLLRVLPSWSLRQKILRQKTPLKLGFRIIEGTHSISSRGRVGLKSKIGPEKEPTVYQFSPVESGAGALRLSVTYRASASFKTDDTEAIIARQLMEQGELDRPRSTSSSVTSLGSALRPVVSFTRPFKNSEIPRRNTSSTNIYQTEPVAVPISVPGPGAPSSLGQSSSTTSSAPRFSSSFARSARLRSISGTGSASSHSSYEPGSVFQHSEVSEFMRFVDDAQRKANSAFHSDSLEDSSLSRFQMMRSSSLGDSIAQIEACSRARASASPPPSSQSPPQRRRYSHIPAHPSRLSEQIVPGDDGGKEKEKEKEKHDDDLVFAFKV